MKIIYLLPDFYCRLLQYKKKVAEPTFNGMIERMIIINKNEKMDEELKYVIFLDLGIFLYDYELQNGMPDTWNGHLSLILDQPGFTDVKHIPTPFCLSINLNKHPHNKYSY